MKQNISEGGFFLIYCSSLDPYDIYCSSLDPCARARTMFQAVDQHHPPTPGVE
jgi:hypothetical protein